MVAFEKYKQILKEAAAILPKGCLVILLADRGFDDNDLFCAARDLGWGFRIRLKKSLRVYRVSKPCLSVDRLMPAKGRTPFLHKVWITDRRFGPVYLALAHVQTRNGFEEWAILSDDTTDLRTFDEYGLRFDLEENFLDDKSAGFQLESGEIRNVDVLTRLGLILATATLYLVSTGTAIVSLGLRHLLDTHWQRGLSYFQMLLLILSTCYLFFGLNLHLILIPLWRQKLRQPGPLPPSLDNALKSHKICQSIRWMILKLDFRAIASAIISSSIKNSPRSSLTNDPTCSG
jgi:hypothetical protein